MHAHWRRSASDRRASGAGLIVWIVRAFLDRIILLMGVVAAGCVPGFIVQYRQRLAGRLDEVMLNLAPFQAIADREHHGSLAELISYHLQSSDPTFHQEGAALQSMLDSAERLRAMMQSLNTDLAHQFAYLLIHSDNSLLRATWGDFRPGFALEPQGIVFALVVGVSLWALFMMIWHATAWLWRAMFDSSHAPAPRMR
jgi:hypothetical protein